MANSIKQSGEGAALQVTKPARAADLAASKSGEDYTGAERWARLADVRVYGFDELLLVFDRDRVDITEMAELVATTARDTKSIHLGSNASLRPAGNGCMVSLPGITEAGFHIGDTAAVHPGPNMLAITKSSADIRIVADLLSIRRDQID